MVMPKVTAPKSPALDRSPVKVLGWIAALVTPLNLRLAGNATLQAGKNYVFIVLCALLYIMHNSVM